MEKKNLIFSLNTMLLLVVLILIPNNTTLAKTQEKSDLKDMEYLQVITSQLEVPAIPPIDAAAPTTFETASFGLG